jgi:hypothetical protein
MAQSQHPKSLHTSPLTQRQKHLNVIYFIDSSKTRSFKVSLKWTYLAVGFMAFLVFWFFFSGIMLMAVANQNAKSHTRIKNLLGTIFQYQSRYDQVYETAYESSPQVAKQAEIAANKGKAAPPAKPAEIAKPQEPAKKVETAAATKEAEPKKPEANPAAQVPFPIEVIDFVDKGFESYVQVKFAIRNFDSTRKISGYVWGVATYENADGVKTYVGSPAGVRLNADGQAPTGKSGDRFGLKFFKAKTFIFPFPASQGRFTEIKVFVANVDGDLQFTKELKTNYAKPVAIKKVEPARPTNVALPAKSTPPAQTSAPTEPEVQATPSSTAAPSHTQPGETTSDSPPTSTDEVQEEEGVE